MPKKMMTGARTGLAQIGDRMYSTVMEASHPERALKDEVMRIKGALPPEQLDSVLGRVYVKLGSSERTAPVAGYMKDMYGLGTTHRLFDPPKEGVQIIRGKAKWVGAKLPPAGRIRTISKAEIEKLIRGEKKFVTIPGLQPVTVLNADRAEMLLPPKKTTASESSDTNSSTGSGGGNLHDKLNLKAVTDFCLRAKYYDDVYPIYVMLLDLFYCVNDKEWDEAKKTIQAHLEKLAPRGSNNTIHNGDMVNEKHVKHIDTVEANGVGFAEKVAASAPKRDGRKRSAQTIKVVTDVYEYTYYNSEGGTQRITRLYQALKELGWIDQDTTPDMFLQLFSGEPGAFHIKWTGTQSDLYALIKRLHDKPLITCPHGATLWVIARNHFKDKESKSFTNWNKQKEGKKAKETINFLVDLLVPKK